MTLTLLPAYSFSIHTMSHSVHVYLNATRSGVMPEKNCFYANVLIPHLPQALSPYHDVNPLSPFPKIGAPDRLLSYDANA